MKKLMNWFKNEESGQGMVEYGLILVLVAIVVIVALRAIGTNASKTFSKAASAVKQ